MDKKTFAQFLLFCSAVLVAWWAVSYFMFRPRPGIAEPPPIAVPAAPPGEAGPAAPAAPPMEAPGEPAALRQAEEPPEPLPEPVTAALDNGMIRALWTNRGAALMQLDLLDERYKAPYKEGGKRPVLRLLRDFQEGLYSDVLETITFHGPGRDGSARSLESNTADRVYELTDATDDRLTFSTVVRDLHGHALAVRKSVSVVSAAHHYGVALEFENVSQEPCEFAFALRGPAGIERETLQTPFLGTRVAIAKGPGDYSIKKTSPGDLRKGPRTNESANITWAGVVNHYFVAVLEPENDDWVGTVVSRTVVDTDIQQALGRWPVGSVSKESQRPALARQNATVVIHSVRQRLAPGEKLTARYRLIAAPKEDDVLEAYDVGLPGLIEFGILPSVSRVVLVALNGIHRILPNYGVALIILTVLVRVLLHPLTRKSQISMEKMQKLQPLVQEIQKKHAGDKQKLTQEQMALWRKYGVSPMSGCLPMLLQMPVLFALFGALRAAIELRHAGFLWVDDLSAPDTLFHFPFFLPFLQNKFNLLPLLMAAVMVLTQRSTMQAATEQARQQQKMMKLMPIIFAVFLYHMPSGLCLYILTSTSVGMFERWLVARQTADLELRPVGEAPRKERRRPGPAKPPARTGWLGKLEKMIEAQDKESRRARRNRKGK